MIEVHLRWYCRAVRKILPRATIWLGVLMIFLVGPLAQSEGHLRRWFSQLRCHMSKVTGQHWLRWPKTWSLVSPHLPLTLQWPQEWWVCPLQAAKLPNFPHVCPLVMAIKKHLSAVISSAFLCYFPLLPLPLSASRSAAGEGMLPKEVGWAACANFPIWQPPVQLAHRLD